MLVNSRKEAIHNFTLYEQLPESKKKILHVPDVTSDVTSDELKKIKDFCGTQYRIKYILHSEQY